MIRRYSHQSAKITVLVFVAGLVAITATPALASGTFQKTGSMNVARMDHTATLLANGEVLVTGGVISGASAELYNPSTGTWSFTGSMTTARFNHQAVLLQNGEVLVAGGGSGILLASAELYDPSTGVWTATGSMNTARANFSLTLLTNGQVLAVQGTSAELYNPATGTWTVTGSPTSPVAGPDAALLLNGQVLAIERTNSTLSQLYDPSSGTWSATGNTDVFVPNPFVFRLPSGDVFVTGSYGSGIASYADVALYDPSTGLFTPESGPCNCRAYGAAMLQTGMVLVAGGFITVPARPYPKTESITSAELWDPSTQVWTSTGNLNTSRGRETITVLANGQALVTGGQTIDQQTGHPVVLATAELYKP
jgi:hypothetical protein